MLPGLYGLPQNLRLSSRPDQDQRVMSIKIRIRIRMKMRVWARIKMRIRMVVSPDWQNETRMIHTRIAASPVILHSAWLSLLDLENDDYDDYMTTMITTTITLLLIASIYNQGCFLGRRIFRFWKLSPLRRSLDEEHPHKHCIGRTVDCKALDQVDRGLHGGKRGKRNGWTSLVRSYRSTCNPPLRLIFLLFCVLCLD